MSKPKPAPLPSGTVVGGYQIVKKLAAGGFGVVYLAEGENQQLVAIKGPLGSNNACGRRKKKLKLRALSTGGPGGTMPESTRKTAAAIQPTIAGMKCIQCALVEYSTFSPG